MLPIIPYPHHVDLSDIRITIPASVNMAVYPTAALTLKDYALRTHNIHMAIDPNGAVAFAADPSMAPDAYTLTAEEGRVVITAADARGAQNGVSTLIQLMQPAEGGFTVPQGTIRDASDSPWRGIMVDIARNWKELHVLFEYVDLCRFYKIKYLHLHFTDDQSYTLPSKAYPNLSTPGRHYTEEEIKALITYARARSVEIIPEIDVPGHCTSFVNAYGDLFGTFGVIRQDEASMAAMDTIFTELCELFSDSTYIHMGGDEAAIDKWLTDEPTVAAFRAAGVDVDGMEPHDLAQHMYASFIARVCQTILSCGKTPVVWEGFGESVNHMIPRETVVMSWENFYQTTPSLQAAGFRLVNCSWLPLYSVIPTINPTREQVYDWSVYKWRPAHKGSPYYPDGMEIQPTTQVEGGQLLAWGDVLESSYPVVAEGVRVEQALLESNAPALAENLWNRSKVSDWEEFSERAAKVDEIYAAFRAGK